MAHTDDDTIIVRRPARRGRGPRLAGAAIAAATALAATLYLLGAKPAALPLADAAAIEAEQPQTLTLHRFAANPRILILDFPDLQQQGLMFNRVAAFAEKARAPRDRLLTDAELAATLAARGDTTASYYYGHDYDSRTLARFFTLADRDAIALNAQEQMLRAIAQAQGILADGANQALITLPKLGADSSVDRIFRHAILLHELSHGEFFTTPAYRDYVNSFWQTGIDAPTRASLTKFLQNADYDPDQPSLIINEAQAYLIFTPDPRLVSAASLGLSPQTLTRLRAAFLAAMPLGWLKDAAP